MNFDMKVIAAILLAVGVFLPFRGWFNIFRAACLILGIWLAYDELRG